MIQLATERGFETLVAETHSQLSRINTMLEKRGFSKIGIRLGTDGGVASERVMYSKRVK